MIWIVRNLWVIPAMPIFAAGVTAVTKSRCRRFAASLATGSIALSFLFSLCAFARVLQFHNSGIETRQIFNFRWFQIGDQWLTLGWVLDPLTAVMLMMITCVGLLIFIYSVGYMSHDENFTRFFCFLALFAGAMLGLVIANSLLLLFICWEIVGVTSYLLIGFWYYKPSAAAAAKKAFITTRIGDLAFFFGMIWLYSKGGSLLFYDNSAGCLEPGTLLKLAGEGTGIGLAVSSGIALLIFCGAVGKSGQIPLHVWLPDAMEGPTPVSALIHAATMVAAGVFLLARMYPLLAVHGLMESLQGQATVALSMVTWVGAITAVFAATIAIAQDDIKRILAYSTVSQLGYMMVGLGAGGVTVGMFHLITHAFFKALLFMGAGSVIHGCNEEQNIRHMGGLRWLMPMTFVTYAVGMLALTGFPLFFSGFWSKDAILHSASLWNVSRGPYYLAAIGVFLTAFYMTRQVRYVFFGRFRGHKVAEMFRTDETSSADQQASRLPHESPPIITIPLIVLALFAVGLSFLGTPAWPWFSSFLSGVPTAFDIKRFSEQGVLEVALSSIVIVFLGYGIGWLLYGGRATEDKDVADPLEQRQPQIFGILRNGFYVDSLYKGTLIRLVISCSHLCDWFDRWIWGGVVWIVSHAVLGLAWLNRTLDTFVVNRGFDETCRGVAFGGKTFSRLQDGRTQSYLRILGVAFLVLALVLLLGHHG